jgi:hypothetical protein
MSHFVVDDGDTYALDKASKGLWIYRRSNFELEPDAFFNGVAPVVDDVVDLANNMDDAYLLHQDGSLTLCTYSGFKNSPTACSAVRYTDARPGRERLPFVPLSPFAQVQSTLPPDPAIFFLETLQPNIDHFSLHNLVFQGQFIPKKALPVSRPAGAFLVDNRGRILYLAFGSQVYYGIMP